MALDLLVEPLDLAVRLRVAHPGRDMPYAEALKLRLEGRLPRLRPSASLAKNREPWSVMIEAGRPCLAMPTCGTASALAAVASLNTPYAGR